MWASGGSPYPSAAGGGGAGPRPYWSRPELHGRAEPALESVRFTETSVSAVNVGLTSLDQLRDRVPEDVRRKVVSVDVSMNYLSDLQAVAALFPSLKHLVADGNRIHRLGNFLGGSLPDLETLWLNKNSVTDLSSAMSDLRGSASLKYLSLLGNPCCSHAVGLGQGGAAAAAGAGDWGAGETELYRAFVAHHLPSLRFLDESPVEGRDRLFFSGAELEYAYVWVRLKQTGWCKAAMAVVGNADGDGEIRVWEVLADGVDVQREASPASDTIASLKKGSLVAVTRGAISHGDCRVEVCVGNSLVPTRGRAPRGWVSLRKDGTPLLRQKKFNAPAADARPLFGAAALRRLGEEIVAVVRKVSPPSSDGLVHTLLKGHYHREYGAACPSLRSQREELGLSDIPALIAALPPLFPQLSVVRERGEDGGWLYKLQLPAGGTAVSDRPRDAHAGGCSGCAACGEWAAELRAWEARLAGLAEKLLAAETSLASEQARSPRCSFSSLYHAAVPPVVGGARRLSERQLSVQASLKPCSTSSELLVNGLTANASFGDSLPSNSSVRWQHHPYAT